MRAINLVPAEERRGAGGAAGRSGGAAYVLLALLTVLVILVTSHTLTKRATGEKRSQLATTEAQAAAAEARAGELASFTRFTALRATRTATVTSLAASRFDWSHAMRELARVVPAEVTLTGLQGTVVPGVALKASTAGATSGLRAALQVPAIEMVGCTKSQNSVAEMIVRMRLIDGVQRVALQSSVKAESTSGERGRSGRGCREGGARSPQFALVVFFDPVAGAVPTAAAAARLAPTSLPTVATGPTGATGPTATGVAP